MELIRGIPSSDNKKLVYLPNRGNLKTVHKIFPNKISSKSHCHDCSTSQNGTGENTPIIKISSMNQKSMSLQQILCNYGFNEKARTKIRISLWSTILFIWMSVFIGLTEGLQCYECLSLYCDSGAVCDAIKNTMVDIFVPKRHFIHFDPSDICPDEELPMNAIQWANLSRECERSDSICLISPIEVHTVVDGKKHGKMLENEYTLMTYGYLRGCASRRKLLEFPETINVRIEFSGRNNGGKNRVSSSNNGTSTVHHQVNRTNGSTSSSSEQHQGRSVDSNSVHGNNNKKKSEIFYNMTNLGNGADINPTKKTYKDGYTISKIYSHVFYIDQGTKNATRCYADNCNDKVKFPRIGTSGVKMLRYINSSTFLSVFATFIMFK